MATQLPTPTAQTKALRTNIEALVRDVYTIINETGGEMAPDRRGRLVRAERNLRNVLRDVELDAEAAAKSGAQQGAKS